MSAWWEMSEFEDQPLGFLVRGLMARLRPHAVQALRPLGLGLPEFVCMRILDDDPGRTSAELARHTHVTAQAMNQVLQGLQEGGLVTRPGDGIVGPCAAGSADPQRQGVAQAGRGGRRVLRRTTAGPPQPGRSAPTQVVALPCWEPLGSRQIRSGLMRSGLGYGAARARVRLADNAIRGLQSFPESHAR